MARQTSRHSIFAQDLDRAVFVAYFLGAVVPLLALGWFFAVPMVEQAGAGAGYLSQAGALGRLGILVSCGVLCLGSFLVLQRFIHQTLERLGSDQRRLARLVDVSQGLSEVAHAGEVARAVARAALATCEAEAAYVFLAADKNASAELIDHAGRDADQLYVAAQRPIDAMAKMALESRRPALVGDDRGSKTGLSAAAAVPLPIRSGQEGVVIVVHTAAGRRFDSQHVGTLSTLASIAGVAVSNADLREAQRNFFAHMTDMLVMALDAYLDLQVGHSRRVAGLANVIGRELGFDDARLQGLHFASLMHDIGMFRIPREHWGVPGGYQKHPVAGARMLERIRLWEHLAPFVAHHHEWWNGDGYPEGLAGEDIPLEARIIGIAEAFDGMTTANYRETLSVDEALDQVETHAGTQFDPELAALFVRLVREGKVRTPNA
jgi:HD-GYP domain-containing protein (c-di-GMP phosphodiesterase class II)